GCPTASSVTWKCPDTPRTTWNVPGSSMHRAASRPTTRDLAGYGRAEMPRLATALALLGLAAGLAHDAAAAAPSARSGPSSWQPGLIAPGIDAPASGHFERVWHFGRVTGDLERIIAFYHDVLRLDLRGARNQRLPFLTSAALDEFVATPAGAQF